MYKKQLAKTGPYFARGFHADGHENCCDRDFDCHWRDEESDQSLASQKAKT